MGEEEMAAALRELLATVDRVPEAALTAANAAIGWRRLDGELARLIAESGPQLSHLRGRQPRLLTFRHGDVIVELEVSSDDGVARLLGQVDPPQQADVTIESAAESRSLRTDGQGRFTVTDLPAGWMRVVVGWAAGRPRTTTEWFRA
jgi:hypothetical protein